MDKKLRTWFLAMLLAFLLTSCQVKVSTPIPTGLADETKILPLETKTPDQTRELIETATKIPEVEETEELSFMEQGRALADGTIADLPLCQASMEILSRIDISKVGINGENSWWPYFNDAYDRLVISEQREGYTRITILDKTVGDQWEIVFASDFSELRNYQVELSPSGKYIALIYPTFVSLFNVDMQQIVGKMTPHSQTIRWSWDESMIAVPSLRGISDPWFYYAGEPPRIILFELYSVPYLEYLGPRTNPEEDIWILRELFWIPDQIDLERYLLLFIDKMLLYEGEVFTEVDGLDVNYYNEIVLVEFIDENYYLSSYYRSEQNYSVKDESYSLVGLGLFLHNIQVDEFVLFSDGSTGVVNPYIDIKYDSETGGATAVFLYGKDLLHFDVIDQTISDTCFAYLDQIIDESDVEWDEDFYLNLTSENVGFTFDEEEIVFYQINWE